MESLHLAIDLGASHGRVISGRFTENGLVTEVVYRFAHEVRTREGRLRWDYPALIAGIREGLRRAGSSSDGAPIASVSCDGWAQDFGLLDDEGRLFYSPCCYRDPRTLDLPDRLAPELTWQELQRRNGSAIHRITTLCQLKAMAESERPRLLNQPRLLHIADLVHHDLCGAAATDWTLATASQLWHLAENRWDGELLARLDIPMPGLPPVHMQPAIIGRIPSNDAPHPALADVPVAITAGHDTAAATAVLNPGEPDTLFLSLGTWAMLGCLLPESWRPDQLTPDRSTAYLGLPLRRWGVFRGGTGLWPLQECMREWRQHEPSLDWNRLEAEAGRSTYAGCIDLRHDSLEAPARMTEALTARCRAHGGPPPAARGDIARLVYRSLAAGLADDIRALSRSTGRTFRDMAVVSGGARSALLCRELSHAAGLPIRRGPAEAAATGNLLMQAVAIGILPADSDRLHRIRCSLFEENEP